MGINGPGADYESLHVTPGAAQERPVCELRAGTSVSSDGQEQRHQQHLRHGQWKHVETVF